MQNIRAWSEALWRKGKWLSFLETSNFRTTQ